MKTKRFAKIVTLALTALLLIGVAVGITVSAADTGATEIVIAGQNISYEGAPQILYYVKADGLSDNQTIKIDLQHGEGEVYTKTVATNEDGSYMTATISGQTYYIVYSQGIAPKDMTKTVTAKAYIENSDGSTIEAAATKEYSVYTYAMNRFSKAPTEDQVTLYKALLDYGAAVQAVFAENNEDVAADIEKYGWADAYYKTTANVYVDGEKTDTVISSSNERAVNLVDSEGRYSVVNLGEWYNGAAFLKMTKANDATRISTVAAPGVQEYDVYYVTHGVFQDFETITDVAKLFYTTTGGHYTHYYYLTANATYADIESSTDTTQGNAYLGITSDESGNKILVTGEKPDAKYNAYWRIDMNDGSDAVAVGNTYLIDFDFKINMTGKQSSASEIVRMFLYYLESGNQGTTGALSQTTNLYYGSDNTLLLGNSAKIPLNVGEWYDIRFEYKITGESAALLTVYINGIEAYTATTNKAIAPETFLFTMQQSASRQEYAFDNIWYHSYSENDIGLRHGQGKYYNESLNNRTGATVFDFTSNDPTLTAGTGSVVNNYTEARTNITVVDGIAKIDQAYEAWNVYYAKIGAAITAEATDTVIYEFDYRYDGFSGTEGTQGYIKFYMNGNASNQKSLYVTAYADYMTLVDGVKMQKGKWYNVRLEVVGTAGQIYIDNVPVGNSFTCTGPIDGAMPQLAFEGTAIGKGHAYSLDNIVIDNASVAPDPTYWEQYEAGTLTEGKYKAFDFSEAFAVPNKSSNVSITDPTADAYFVVQDGVLTWGNNAAVAGNARIEVLLEGAGVGDKWVVEYDYMFGGMEPITTYGTSNTFGNVNVYHGNGSTIASMFFNSRGSTVSDTANINFTNANPAATVTKDVWYKIRIELEITEYGEDLDSDGIAYEFTRTYYVDDEPILTQSATSNAYLQKINQLYFNFVANTTNVQHYMDNLVVVLVEAE